MCEKPAPRVILRASLHGHTVLFLLNTASFLCPFHPVHVRFSALDAFTRPLPAKSLCSFVTFLLPKQLERINDELVPSLVVVLVVRSRLVIDHDIGFVVSSSEPSSVISHVTSAGFGRW
jgi:hypothetical protein